mmetsp:Transcript_8781/g.24315  ORF Transcript_8781/g.24315 Transcript_8781/m.24315 type:complete len:408 (-) Transcript_8781:330-1553(-)
MKLNHARGARLLGCWTKQAMMKRLALMVVGMVGWWIVMHGVVVPFDDDVMRNQSNLMMVTTTTATHHHRRPPTPPLPNTMMAYRSPWFGLGQVCGGHPHNRSTTNSVGDDEGSIQNPDWQELCRNGIVQELNRALFDKKHINRHVYVIQIGAHIGFEKNDPIASGLLAYLRLLTDEQQRQRFHWVFVEPSPPNYDRLVENVKQYSHLCNMTVLRAAVVADTVAPLTTSYLPFYSIRDTIDPATGYDSLSGKTFPPWITQISSFRMGPMKFNRPVWLKMGLRLKDYIVQTNVTSLRYSDLVRNVTAREGGTTQDDDELALVLIDTEGLDCEIVAGMNKNNNRDNDNPRRLPRFLVFEQNQCGKPQRDAAVQALTSSRPGGMGYKGLKHPSSKNFVATRLLARQKDHTS